MVFDWERSLDEQKIYMYKDIGMKVTGLGRFNVPRIFEAFTDA